MKAPRLFPLVAALGALAACGDKPESGTERKTAAGEVLGGTVSDAMLPLDTVRSQSPPLREAAGDDGGAPETRSTPSAEVPAPRSKPTAEPAPTPSPSETPGTDE